MEYLKQNEDRWRCRKIDECERIKEAEKKDRLAIVKGKKKRYGLQKLSKEENRRLKSRTEDRIKIAKAKENYCWKFRHKLTTRWRRKRMMPGGTWRKES